MNGQQPIGQPYQPGQPFHGQPQQQPTNGSAYPPQPQQYPPMQQQPTGQFHQQQPPQQQFDPPYKFKTNIPTRMQLIFDTPKRGQGLHGSWALYSFLDLSDGQNKKCFCPNLLDKILTGQTGSGMMLEITKLEVDKDVFDFKKNIWTKAQRVDWTVFQIDGQGNKVAELKAPDMQQQQGNVNAPNELLHQPQVPIQPQQQQVPQNQAYVPPVASQPQPIPQVSEPVSVSEEVVDTTSGNVNGTPENPHATVEPGVAGTIEPTDAEKKFYDDFEAGNFKDEKNQPVQYNRTQWCIAATKVGLDYDRAHNLWDLWITKKNDEKII